MTELTLDFYDVGVTETRYCWKYGDWSSDEYESEFLARVALRNGTLVFSKPDRYDGYEAALIGAKVNFNLDPPFDYWASDEALVLEPALSGQQLGEFFDFVFPENAKVLHFTRNQFEMMVEDFTDKHGDADEV